MITEEQVEQAVTYLRENAKAAAKATAEARYLDDFSKVVKSQQMKLFEGSIANREMEAYSSQAYQEHLKAVEIAQGRDMYHRHMINAAQTVIDVWRTESSNERALGKI